MRVNIPTVFVIFGVTGDLAKKKIIPALFNLHQKKKLPLMMRVIGFSRRDWPEKTFQEYVIKIILSQNKNLKDKKIAEDFLKFFSYSQGNFDNIKDYKNLAEILGRIDGEWKVCSNKLFYLAVPPVHYRSIFNHLHSSGLTIPCGTDEGWTRVLVEKPFGKDSQTAENLDLTLAKLFREEQIYRIDHYLAKEMLQNILNFRFSNNLFEQGWTNKLIEKIQIRLYEKIGVEDRGVFYDGVGALRDVGQNHLLQMLALVTMDRPESLTAEAVRKKRADLIGKLRILSEKEILKNTFRAQYKDYQKVKGVRKNSKTETYFKVRFYPDHPKFYQVPVTIESGKRIKEQKKDIIITFKHPSPCLCPPEKHLHNKVVISIEPREAITIHFWSKKPGLENGIEKQTLNFLYRKETERVQYVGEYEKLLLDCIEGNQLLFLSTDEVKAAWKFIDPIIKVWEKNKVPLEKYTPDTFEAVEKACFIKAQEEKLPKNVGVVGLGKMGANMSRRLMAKGWQVVGFNRTLSVSQNMQKEGLVYSDSPKDLIKKIDTKPKVIILSLPSGKAIDDMIFGANGLTTFLSKGDIIVDAGNSYYKNTIIRAKKLEKKGIHFIDAGVSGGPGGALNGACLIVGGKREVYNYLHPLFLDMSIAQGTAFFEGYGAGHFVKMVHNGIEYGMMQALAEGFAVLKKAKFNLDLAEAARIYNHGSVIESRLVGWLYNALKLEGVDLSKIKGSVDHTGEGEWTVEAAKELKVKIKIIEESFKFRMSSKKQEKLPLAKQDYTGKILSALRNQFGGHKAK